MYAKLGDDRENFAGILEAVKQVAIRHLQQQHELAPGRLVAEIPLGQWDEAGMGALETIKFFEANYANQIAAMAGPRYFGFVTGGSTPASVAGDWLVSVYDQNVAGSADSIAPRIEQQTIHFFKELFGLQAEYFGSFVTGATMANFTGLAIARQWAGEQCNIDCGSDGMADLKVSVASGTPHSSIIKALAMAGIGRKSMHLIPVLPDGEAIDVEALERFLQQQHDPVIVVANAGTVNTVDFDDLEAIGQLKKKYRFWMHVDAAFGGFAACSPKYAHLMNGINHADSITIDAHKWLNVPYDAAMQFSRHRALQLKVFHNNAAYLGDPDTTHDFLHYTPENSRRWRALPSWFTLKAYGKAGCREIVERNCALANRLGEWISANKGYRLLAPVRMNVVCFTLRKEPVDAKEIQKVLDAVRDDGRVFFTPTVYKGVPAIRAAVSNWQTCNEDMDIARQVLESVYSL